MQSEEFDTKKNLIVNYLPSTLSQDDVRQMFTEIGAVNNCKLIRNIATGQSLGYAFVEYADEESASRAIVQITGKEMNGKTIKVSYARQSSPEIKNSNVYIGGLPKWVTEEKLMSLFSPFGSILSHKVLTNPDGTSRGAGFVRFSLNTEATEAIAAMAGKTLPDSEGPLTVKLAIPPASKRDSMQALNAITSSNLAGVGVATRTANVRFNPMAVSNQGLFNPNLQQQTSTIQGAVAAALSKTSIGASQSLMNNSAVAGIPTSIYVYGLQTAHTELTMYELFAPFGAVLNVKLIRDNSKEDKPSKGYGFVNFAAQEDAIRAVSSMNGVPFEERVLQVSLKQGGKQQQQPQQLQQLQQLQQQQQQPLQQQQQQPLQQSHLTQYNYGANPQSQLQQMQFTAYNGIQQQQQPQPPQPPPRSLTQYSTGLPLTSNMR